MLKLVIDEEEFFDPRTEEFSMGGGFEIELEHSLVSLSKWESQTKKSFLSKESKSREELLLYVRAMIISPTYPSDVTDRLTQENIDKIQAYIESPESATTFGNMPQTRGPGETITSELIYYWMVAFNIPLECEFWHLNRLFSLIRICNLKNSKPKKLSHRELAERNRRINEERKAKYQTRG